jgi:polysaccharide export outer membrane protein
MIQKNVQKRPKRRWKEQQMLKNLHLKMKLNGAAVVLELVAACAILAGCQSKEPAFHAPSTPTADTNSPSMELREGMTVRISFPGASTLDNTVPIRQDGKISLPMVGEVKAAGLTPQELEKELLRVYGPQLVVKEVTVTVQTSNFEVYVTGAVLRPGKLSSERVETPLEAVIEAGIDHTKANLKKVVVLRDENGKTERFTLNLDAELKGKQSEPFTLKPNDKIYVPEKFMWY